MHITPYNHVFFHSLEKIWDMDRPVQKTDSAPLTP
jgi:hypothetical protein